MNKVMPLLFVAVLAGLRPVRTCRHRNGRVTGSRPRAVEGVTAAVQAGSCQAG